MRKVALTIDKDKISAGLTDFPVLLTEAVLPAEMFDELGNHHALDGGGDIRFYSDSELETRLACDIRVFTTDEDPDEGKANIVVKVPSISSSSDTTIYMTYGEEGLTQPAANATYGQHAAYNSDYKGVYPLHDAKDRTGGGKDMTATNSPTLNADGLNGGCFESDGSNRYLVRTEAIISPGDMTISGLFRTSNTDKNKEIAAFGDSASSGRTWRLNCGNAFSSTQQITALKQTGTTRVNSAGHTYTTNQWSHAAVRLASTTCQSLLNGTADTNVATSLSPTPTNRTTIGAVIYNGTLFAPMIGKIEEVRFMSALKDASWLTAEHQNLINITTFVEAGTPESIDDHHNLVIQDAQHGLTSENIVLTQKHNLVIQDAQHLHEAENITLQTTGHHDLVIQDAQHIHTAENITLIQKHTLVIQDAQHQHTADNINLSTDTHRVLVIQDATHEHTAESLTFTQKHTLSINDALHQHIAENITLDTTIPIQNRFMIKVNGVWVGDASGVPYTGADKDVNLGDNTLTSKDIITTAGGTITRVDGVITKLEIGDREIDYEYEDEQVKSWEDDNYKWELTKADGLITGWTVTKK